jgi:hypothetical protein
MAATSGSEMELDNGLFEDVSLTSSALKSSLRKHHHPATPVETPRSESELSFDFHYPTDSDEDEDPEIDLTRVAFGSIYVPTKLFKPKRPLPTPVWAQMCRPNPSPTRLPKDHPSYDEEERRALVQLIDDKRIEVDQAATTRRKFAGCPKDSKGYIDGQIWLERELELRWELAAALFRHSLNARNTSKDKETNISLDLVLQTTDELQEILKLNSRHPSGKMLMSRCMDRLPHKTKVALYGPSFTTDWIFRANPKSWRVPFYNHKVPRTKLYDPVYRALTSHEAPAMAWLHYMDIRDGEGISDARARGSVAAAKIQRKFLSYYRYRNKVIVNIQRVYRAHCIRLAVKRKRILESAKQTVIAKRMRGVIARELLKQMKISIVVLQCMVRRRIAMWALYDLRLDKAHGLAAIQMQRMMRGWWRRRCWKLAKHRIRTFRVVVKLARYMCYCTRRRVASITITKYYRCFIQARAWRIHKETVASKKVQTVFRKVQARRNYRNFLASILKIQANFRRKKSTEAVAEVIYERTVEEEVRTKEEIQFVEYVEENCVEEVMKFIESPAGKNMISAVARRLAKKDRSLRQKRFWMWFKSAGVEKLNKCNLGIKFMHYDLLGEGRLTFDAFKSFISNELCIPMGDSELAELATLMDCSVPQGGAIAKLRKGSRHKHVSSHFYVTFESVYSWYATLQGWVIDSPIADKVTNGKKKQKPTMRAKASVSLGNSLSEKEYAVKRRELLNKRRFTRWTTNMYSALAKQTIFSQVRRHARRSAVRRFREVHRPSAVCLHCERAFAFQSDLRDHMHGKISRTKGILKLVMDAHTAADTRNNVVKRWKLSCVKRAHYDATYIERAFGMHIKKAPVIPLAERKKSSEKLLKALQKQNYSAGETNAHVSVASNEQDLMDEEGKTKKKVTNQYVLRMRSAKSTTISAEKKTGEREDENVEQLAPENLINDDTEDGSVPSDVDIDEEDACMDENGFLL